MRFRSEVTMMSRAVGGEFMVVVYQPSYYSTLEFVIDVQPLDFRDYTSDTLLIGGFLSYYFDTKWGTVYHDGATSQCPLLAVGFYFHVNIIVMSMHYICLF